ncbi:MAG: Ig-like domain-containing protein, partial [Acidobacteriota bacterium]
MSLSRKALAVCFALLTLVPATFAATSTTSRYQIVLDTDNNAATGCFVDAGGARFSGAEQIVTTTVVTTGTSASVSGVIRQVCSDPASGTFGSPITVDTSSWPVAFEASSGNMLVETHLPLSAIPDHAVPMRLGFILSAGNISTSIFQLPNGSPILFPKAVGRRHVVTPGNNPRVIHFDGNGNDWQGVSPLVVPGTSSGSTVVRFTDVFAFQDSDQLYFLFHALVNGQAPVANDDTYSSVQGHVLNIAGPGVLGNDVDPLGGTLTASKTGDPAHGTVALSSDGSFSYSNDGSPAGQDAFHYKANNGSADSNVATVTVNLVPNTPPVALPDAYSVAHGGTVAIPAPGVLLNDVDNEGDTLDAVLITPPIHGTLNLAASGGFTYTHNGSNTLSDTFVYIASDGASSSTPTLVTITIGPDAAPVGTADAYTVAEGGTLSTTTLTGPLANDTDVDTPHAVLTMTVVTPPVHAASFTSTANGTFNYVHDGSETTSDSFTYTLSDGILSVGPITVSITITPVNDAPVVTVPAGQTLLEDATRVFSSGNANAITVTDADGGALTEQITLGVVQGTLTLGSTAGITITSGANGSATMTIQGTLAALNTAMNGLTYAPVANYNGADLLTVTANDLGNAGAGGPQTASATVALTITAVNDVPSFTKGADQTVLEDAGAQTVPGWATAISAGPADEASQVLNFNVSNNNNALFSVQPAVAANGTLTYTPATNANGTATVTINLHDNGGVANGGVDTSANQTFVITVTSVNDVPSFTKGADQTVLEDAAAQTVVGWATAISAGPADEAGQTLTFNVSNNNNALFSAQPAVAANGTLTFTPAANQFGTATVSVQLQDNGGVANGGVDTSAVQTFTITITPVNDVPSFTKGADVTVLEDSGSASIAAWATAISAGPNEGSQVVNFLVSNNNNGLFSTQPQVAANGTLSFVPALNANGTATVTIAIHDDGGTSNGGVDTSANQTFVINVTAVNDTPSFTKGADQTVNEDSAAATVTNWATAISAGPADEAGQALTFNVSNDNNGLFSVQPAIAANGTLTFTPAGNANGTATVTVTLSDNGGTANGAQDTSAAQTFTITVTGINDVPSFTKGPDALVLEDSGPAILSGWATAISAGPANESGQTVNFLVSNDNNPLFSVQPAVDASGNLTFTPNANANGVATVTIAIHDDGGTANGGVDTSANQTFTITVTAVNDVPSFTKGADETVLEDTGLHTVNGWATAISAGPPDESGQTVSFNVSNNNNALFSVQPAVSPTGVLTYTLAANAFGSAVVTISISDNGGTANA